MKKYIFLVFIVLSIIGNIFVGFYFINKNINDNNNSIINNKYGTYVHVQPNNKSPIFSNIPYKEEIQVQGKNDNGLYYFIQWNVGKTYIWGWVESKDVKIIKEAKER